MSLVEFEELVWVVFEPGEIKLVVQEVRGCLSDSLHDSWIFFAEEAVSGEKSRPGEVSLLARCPTPLIGLSVSVR